MLMASLYKRICLWVFCHPRTVIFCCLFSALVSVFFVSRISVEADLEKLLPENSTTVRDLKRWEQQYGGMSHLVIGLEVAKSEDATRFLDDLAIRLRLLPSVRTVSYQRPVSFFSRHLPLYFDLSDLQEIEQYLLEKKEGMQHGASPIFDHLLFSLDDSPDLNEIFEKYQDRIGSGDIVHEYYQNKEGTLFAMLVRPSVSAQNVRGSREFLTEVKQVVADLKPASYGSGVQVYYTGDYQKIVEEEAKLRQDITKISAGVFLLLMLVLIVYYRRFSPVLLIGGTLLVGILWTGAIIYFVVGHVNLVTSFSIAILAGLGSDYGIYLLTRFFQERENGKTLLQAYQGSFTHTMAATRLSVITTMIAFGVLMFSHFKGFSELGLIGFAGMATNYLAIHSFFPALLVLLDQKKMFQWERRLFPWSLRLHLKKGTFQIYLPVLVTFFVVGLLSSSHLSGMMRVHYNPHDLQDETLPSHQIGQKFNLFFERSLHPAVLLLEGGETEERELLSWINASKETFTMPMLKEGIGLSSFFPLQQEEKTRVIYRIQSLLQKMDVAFVTQAKKIRDVFLSANLSEPILQEKLPGEITQLFANVKNEERIIYLFPKLARDSTERIEAFGHQLRAIVENGGQRVTAISDTLIITDIIALVEKEIPLLLGATALLSLLVLFLKLRKGVSAFLICGMIAFAFVLFLGAMKLFGFHFNLFNLVVLPIVVGVGIDSFVHFYLRYQEQRMQLIATFNTISPAIFVANLTTMIGFGGLIFSGNPALRSVGWLVILGIGAVTLVNLFFLPALLTCWHQVWRKQKPVSKQDNLLLPSS